MSRIAAQFVRSLAVLLLVKPNVDVGMCQCTVTGSVVRTGTPAHNKIDVGDGSGRVCATSTVMT